MASNPTMNAYLAGVIAAVQPADNEIRTGTVFAIEGKALVVLSNNAQIPAGYLASYVPRVGDTVALIRQGADWLCLGMVAGAAMPVQKAALVEGWGDWDPVLTNITVGTGGVVTAHRRILNGSCDYRFKFVMGTGSAIAANPSFTLPVAPHSSYSTTRDVIGRGTLRDEGTANRDAVVRLLALPSTAFILSYSSTGDHAQVNATAPWTWSAANGDALSVEGSYRIADGA